MDIMWKMCGSIVSRSCISSRSSMKHINMPTICRITMDMSLRAISTYPFLGRRKSSQTTTVGRRVRAQPLMLSPNASLTSSWAANMYSKPSISVSAWHIGVEVLFQDARSRVNGSEASIRKGFSGARRCSSILSIVALSFRSRGRSGFLESICSNSRIRALSAGRGRGLAMIVLK
ncbi:hypothetical protein BD626DRAFT_411 [Schizophyllum amplum]|uniref:Uncharacterized protein n=1 Tax=Schizophyllum amplum TaxID=97359 RepID=A0A550CVH3_9AGAR|nr:hypothetical protein BD626DRAFT_411 [Auriculariopsis ampla]